MTTDGNPQNLVSRRQFLTGGAMLGGSLAAAAVSGGSQCGANAILNSRRPDADYEFIKPENVLYSACLQCNTGCGIKCKLQDGVLTKIDGNPYNPWVLWPHLPMSISPFDAAQVDGSICPKGQAGLQSAYDPYRIRKVLKRAGRRGENRWISIPFEQAIREIVEGGKLFAHVPGEERREVEGLRSLMALKDDRVAKAMAADVKALWAENDRRKKADMVAKFKATHADHLSALIDPAHPDLGPKNNQFVMCWGRIKNGRSDFIKRFGDCFGTINLHGHTTVCQGSLYFASKAMSEQYIAGSFSNGQKFYWQADLDHAEFVLFVGANLFEANYGPPNRSARLSKNIIEGKTRIAVVDPRFSKLASKAWKWLPIKPGTDGALAMAVLLWIFENERFDARFLSCANKAAAYAAGELTWTNATWLVKIDPASGKPTAFVRAADAGLASSERRSIRDPANETRAIEYEEKFLLVMQGGRPVAVDPNDEKNAVIGDLFVNGKLPDGTLVKSSLEIIREAAFEKSFEEWCHICELNPPDVAEVTRELTRHGKRAVVEIHRGVSQHTNGFYNVLGWYAVNALLGNYDWKGGLSIASTYGYDGRKGGPFDLSRVAGKLTAFGISIIRHDVAYEATTLFTGYPAKRNWYPLSSDIYQEIIPSIGESYPYPIKALFMYMGAPTYALPSGHINMGILADVNKLPLFFACDIVIGPTSMWADYIFPDLSYLERWEFQGSHPNMNMKVEPVRQPVIAPIPEICSVYGNELPICFETLLMGLAERLGMKGFGANAMGDGIHLCRPEDFYVRAVANIAAGARPDMSDAVPDASVEETALFEKSRRHLPPTVFDIAHWKLLVGETLWPKVVYVLNRGGRFQDIDAADHGPHLANPYRRLLCLYQEKTAMHKHSGTGQNYPGHACYIPLSTYTGQSLNRLAEGYDLHLITHRTISQTKSRTVGNYWLRALMPENALLLNPVDGRRLGLSNGQQVLVISATNPSGYWNFSNGQSRPVIGVVKLTESIRPGVVSFALGFGLWATGAADVIVDGKLVPGEQSRAAGIHANASMWTDPDIPDTALFDPVGGSVSFYDTMVKLIKI